MTAKLPITMPFQVVSSRRPKPTRSGRLAHLAMKATATHDPPMRLAASQKFDHGNPRSSKPGVWWYSQMPRTWTTGTS